MTYRGWVLHTIATGASADQAAQLDAEAMRWLDQAITTDPTYPDARVFRAILLRNVGDYAGAQADLDAVDDSQIPPFMQNMVTSVRAEVQAGLTGLDHHRPRPHGRGRRPAGRGPAQAPGGV